MNDEEQITGRTKNHLVRLWDRNFNLLASAEGDTLDDAMDELLDVHVTVDYVDGSVRKAGRISSAEIAWPERMKA